jgi:hypothetical protein
MEPLEYTLDNTAAAKAPVQRICEHVGQLVDHPLSGLTPCEVAACLPSVAHAGAN